MAVPDAAEYVRRYQEAMGRDSTRKKYIDGINKTAVNPMAEAARPESMELYINRVRESVESGRRAAKLLAVPKQRWSGNATGIGAARLADGAKKAEEKSRAFATKYGPVWAATKEAVKSMPKGTREAAKARSAAVIDMFMDAAGR